MQESSPRGAATNWMPTGRFSFVKPHGMDIAWAPIMFVAATVLSRSSGGREGVQAEGLAADLSPADFEPDLSSGLGAGGALRWASTFGAGRNWLGATRTSNRVNSLPTSAWIWARRRVASR